MRPHPWKARPGITLIEILVVVILIGIMFAISFQSFAGSRDRSNNAQVDGNLRQIEQALLVYQADTERFPELLAWDGDAAKTHLLTPNLNVHYLPGDVLPRTGWTENWQANNIPDADMPAPTSETQGLYRMADLNDGRIKVRVPAIADKLGAGIVPPQPGAGGPAGIALTFRHYGTVLYETNANRSLFILHGVGKQRGDARVVAIATNAR